MPCSTRCPHNSLNALLLGLVIGGSGLFCLSSEVRFTPGLAREGLWREESRVFDFELAMDLRVNGVSLANLQQSQVQVERKRETLLEVAPGGAIKVGVVFLESKEIEIKQGSRTETAQPVAGRSYVISRLPGFPPRIVRADGSTPGPDELKTLLGAYGDLTAEKWNMRELSALRLKPGQRSRELEESLRSFMDAGEVRQLSIIFAGRRWCGWFARCGEFTISLELRSAIGEGAYMTLPLKGTLLIQEEESRPLRLDLAGPVQARGVNLTEGRKVEMYGTGRARMSFRYDYH